ncbi:unnamed protein product, partial [Ectocarpus sp. 12 AP-2014]
MNVNVFTTLFEKITPSTPMALMRMSTLVFMLQGVIAWGVVTSSNDGTLAAEGDLSMPITTTSEFPWVVIIGTLTALILSALTGQDAVVDILARFYGSAERCLSTATQFVKTW